MWHCSAKLIKSSVKVKILSEAWLSYVIHHCAMSHNVTDIMFDFFLRQTYHPSFPVLYASYKKGNMGMKMCFTPNISLLHGGCFTFIVLLCCYVILRTYVLNLLRLCIDSLLSGPNRFLQRFRDELI